MITISISQRKRSGEAITKTSLAPQLPGLLLGCSSVIYKALYQDRHRIFSMCVNIQRSNFFEGVFQLLYSIKQQMISCDCVTWQDPTLFWTWHSSLGKHKVRVGHCQSTQLPRRRYEFVSADGLGLLMRIKCKTDTRQRKQARNRPAMSRKREGGTFIVYAISQRLRSSEVRGVKSDRSAALTNGHTCQTGRTQMPIMPDMKVHGQADVHCLCKPTNHVGISARRYP